MNLQQGGKSKSSKSSKTSKTSKSKKGGNFLGSVSELFVPTGWENFATAAGLLAIDRADAAFRRSRNSSKKQKGGADIDGHESIENMENLMQELDSESFDLEGPQQMNGGGKKSTKKSKTTKTTKTEKTKKSAAIKSTKSTKKGGNFLGAVGELVAPTGWESFATTAGLFALDRADAALRRGTKEKKMKGGKCEGLRASESLIATMPIFKHNNNNKLLWETNLKNNREFLTEETGLINPQIRIICQEDGRYNLQLMGTCMGDTFVYTNDQSVFKMDDFDSLKKFISIRASQLKFIRSCLKSTKLYDKCRY
jgi:hypothetical protein